MITILIQDWVRHIQKTAFIINSLITESMWVISKSRLWNDREILQSI